MKGSNDTSGPGQAASSAPSSANGKKSPHSRRVDGFSLTGTSSLPDPTTHAYRKDLADAALAGLVIASHYAEPLVRHLVADANLLADADDASNVVAQLKAGDELRMLDSSRGWAWGYAPNGRVGYVRAEAVGI